jgi:hypothetical protein
VHNIYEERSLLPFKAVLIHCLDIEHHYLCSASGFIRKEHGLFYLYTCWHVVTSFDRNKIEVGMELPKRAFLKVFLQNVSTSRPGIEEIGGNQEIIIPLYDFSHEPKIPLWFQDKRHIPHADLNNINIFVPFWNDAIKIALPDSVRVSEYAQLVQNTVFSNILTVGDKMYVAGYPYGFSSGTIEKPIPVVLTRFVASTEIKGKQNEIILESTGAPSMSGSPVFIERDGVIYLFGLYTGILYPDHIVKGNEKYTALGTCADMTTCFREILPMVRNPDEC